MDPQFAQLLYRWLSIPPTNAEPNHYEVLGVAAEENDPMVIKNACDQRAEPLRTIELETGTEQRQASEWLKALFQAKRRLDQRLNEAAKTALMTTGTAFVNDEARTPNSTAETPV